MKKNSTILAFFLLLGVAHAVTIVDVRIVNQKGESYTISSVNAFTSFKVGDEIADLTLIRSGIAQDVRRMRESGRFFFVNAWMDLEDEGAVIFYAVTLKKQLRRVEIVGNTTFNNRKIFRNSKLVLGEFADEASFALAAGRIKEVYRSDWYPDVEVEWEQHLDETAGTVEVTFHIFEGKKQSVSKISFAGDNHISDDSFLRRATSSLVPVFLRHDDPDVVSAKILRAQMKQNVKKWHSYFSKSGKLDQDAVDVDRFAIQSFYMDNGYLDAEVLRPEKDTSDPKHMQLVYTINEGVCYRIGSVSIVGAESVDADAMRAKLYIQPGAIASYSAIEAGSESIRTYYGDRGYVRVGVQWIWEIDAISGQVNIRYEVTEGKVGHINEIVINGQTRSRDKIIRRELVVKPGEKFNRTNTQISERRLRNLNFFKMVNITPEPTGAEGKYNLNVQVEEQPTGQIMAGVGFSSIDDLVGYIELSQGNFDIASWPPVGNAQKFKVRVQAGTSRNDVIVSFVEPWFLERPLSLGVDLYHREARYYSDVYEQKTDGARLSLGHRVTDFIRASVAYSIEQFDVYDVRSTASHFFKDEEGKRIKSSVALTLQRNTTDHFMFPTRGNRSSITPFVAGGILGGETDIYGIRARSTQFFPLFGGTVLNVRGEIEAVDWFGDSSDVPIFDRLFLGGGQTLRGFKYRDVGPMDVDGEPIGGRSSAYVTVEYLVPFWNRVRGVVFYDGGFVNKDTFDFDPENYFDDWGVGVRFDIPNFPLQLDYAWPINYDSTWNDDKGRFNFNIGHTF